MKNDGGAQMIRLRHRRGGSEGEEIGKEKRWRLRAGRWKRREGWIVRALKNRGCPLTVLQRNASKALLDSWCSTDFFSVVWDMLEWWS